MNHITLMKLVADVDQLISSFVQNEQQMYVVIDLAHQIRDELMQSIALVSDEQDL